MSTKPIKITGTNLFVLRDIKKQMGDSDSIENRLPATDIPHAKRLLAAGLIEVENKRIKITPAGHAEMAKGATR